MCQSLKIWGASSNAALRRCPALRCCPAAPFDLPKSGGALRAGSLEKRLYKFRTMQCKKNLVKTQEQKSKNAPSQTISTHCSPWKCIQVAMHLPHRAPPPWTPHHCTVSCFWVHTFLKFHVGITIGLFRNSLQRNYHTNYTSMA